MKWAERRAMRKAVSLDGLRLAESQARATENLAKAKFYGTDKGKIETRLEVAGEASMIIRICEAENESLNNMLLRGLDSFDDVACRLGEMNATQIRAKIAENDRVIAQSQDWVGSAMSYIGNLLGGKQ